MKFKFDAHQSGLISSMEGEDSGGTYHVYVSSINRETMIHAKKGHLNLSICS